MIHILYVKKEETVFCSERERETSIIYLYIKISKINIGSYLHVANMLVN